MMDDISNRNQTVDNTTVYFRVKEQMHRRGIRMKDLARRSGRSATWIYQVMRGEKISRPVAVLIEEAVEAERGSLFPYVLTEPQYGQHRREAAVNE